MAEYSYPIIEQPMTGTQWQSVTRGIGDGILDEGGFPYRLTDLDNSTNTGVIRTPVQDTYNHEYGAAILSGFYHRYDDDITLEFPAVTATTLYHVVLQYDPARSEQPVQLRVLESPLDHTQGKTYLNLYTVTRRADELLTDATVRMLRPRVAPVQVYQSYEDLPLARRTLLGTMAIVYGEAASTAPSLYMAMAGDTEESVSGWYWKKIYDPADNGMVWTPWADSSTYASPGAGGTFKRAIGRQGKRRELRGTVKRVSGDRFLGGGQGGTGTDGYNIALASGEGPSSAKVFIVSTSGTNPPGYARAVVNTDGMVSVYPARDCDWVSLDGIAWEVP